MEADSTGFSTKQYDLGYLFPKTVSFIRERMKYCVNNKV